MQPYQPPQNQTANTVVGIVIILIAVLVIGFFTYMFWDQIIPPEAQTSESKQRVYALEIKATHNGVTIPVNYQLREEPFILTQGTTTTNTAEIYSGVNPNANYRLRAWSENYYYGETTCKGNQQICEVALDKVATPAVFISQTKPNQARIFLTKNRYEVVRAPIFCIEHSPNLIHVEMALPEVEIPEHYKSQFDHCYKSEDFRDWEEQEFIITFEQIHHEDNYLNVLIIDRGINAQLEEQYATGNMNDLYASTIIK